MAKKQESGLREAQEELNRQIKEQAFQRVYLLCGEQAYLRTQNRDKLREAVLAGGDKMNAAYYTGDGFTAHDVIGLAETMPFFAERRVIVLENTFLWGNRGGSEAEHLAEYIKDIPETTVLIFVEEKPKGTTKLYKQIKKYGFILNCETPSDRDMAAWTAGRFRREGHRIAPQTLAFFLSYVGTDMLTVENEVRKLVSYAGEREEITKEDILTISSPLVRDQIFDMISAIGEKNPDRAMKIYMDLLKLQTPPPVILSLMTRQYGQLLQAQELLRSHPEREAAQLMGANPWVFSHRICPMLRYYQEESLVQALDACIQAGMDFRSGKADPQIAVERLIAANSQNTA
ncbi:MAG: DNA polymerase III subunit delta [Lachnospiraceae bacterium]|jgi:DNA polymerase-3 subunit delta|nr:DNA polymerase III subunit delta [Lachnospiraceae bacterium]MCI1424270.1 DNA polymerase III subunit delta [Lachnospiraceae bacterium]MCI1451872.1 DNA polymerase III subunit delta [Lachnospiraceae bacterium]MDD5849300.1 DNA polymerase III subunit delta [Bacillota bacterium]